MVPDRVRARVPAGSIPAGPAGLVVLPVAHPGRGEPACAVVPDKFPRAAGRRGFVEITLLTARWGVYLTVLPIVVGPVKAAAFLGVQLEVVGVYLGCTFAPNHKGMPVLPPEARPDFLRPAGPEVPQRQR